MATLRSVVFAALVVPVVALAQGESLDPKVIVVPYPGMSDAGVVATPPPTPPVVEQPPPPPPTPPTEPPPADAPVDRTLQANPPLPPVDQPAAPSQDVMGTPQDQPGAFIDGKPREGAFLSGPGSMTFLLHQTSMTGLGVLSTQMIPRLVEAYCLGQMGCTNNPEVFTGPDARVAYLAGSLIGAGVGFGASAWWQFNHWISHRSANFGIINSFVGAAFFGGLTDLIAGAANASPRGRAEAVTWSILLGSVAGSWLSMIIGGGDIPMNKATLVVSGAAWAMIYTALIAGMVAAVGSRTNDIRPAIDGLLITPAIGAAAMAFATLKFNPSTMQIMRANLFGIGVGAAVFLLSGLVLGLNWGRDATGVVPYILGAVGAIGAKTVVSIFWVEAAENPGAAQPGAPQSWAAPEDDERKRKVSVWW
ncbi:MAG: hypothetical protein MUC96_31910 [Myxococcaceae bacterium]|nr:hypothetical protein [Myxococcaceae bacterium]